MVKKYTQKIKENPLILFKIFYLNIFPLIILLITLLILFFAIIGISYIYIDFNSLNRILNIFSIMIMTTSIIFYYILKFSKKRFWFSLTLLLMFFTSIMGVFILHILNGISLTTIGVLFSTVFFSLPVGMENLKKLYDNKNE